MIDESNQSEGCAVMNSTAKQYIKVARSAPIDLYVAGTNGRFFWPYRLQPADESSPSVRRSCLKYILDSGFQNSNTVSNDDLIEMAEQRDPTYVIPNDCIRDDDTSAPEAIKRTAQSVSEFLDSVSERWFPSTVLVPLQPPYDEHYRLLEREYERQAHRRHFALGGLKMLRPHEQVDHIRRFRETVGWDVYAHGFGLGASRHAIEVLREEPKLLDSADVSTPQQHARTGKIAGASRRPVYFGPATGTDSSTTAGTIATAELVEIARMLSPSITTDEDITPNWSRLPFDAPEEETSRTTTSSADELDAVNIEVTD